MGGGSSRFTPLASLLRVPWASNPEVPVKLVCPKCEYEQNLRPDELLGRFFVCHRCGRICRWKAPAAEPEGDMETAPAEEKIRREGSLSTGDGGWRGR